MNAAAPRSGLQDRLASLLGSEPAARAGVVQRMLHRGPVEVTGYWLQLVVATGIATLGLALGSTAVVIGAMLVAPLMGPILSLGMGLAVGSPFLVLRSGMRVAISIALVVAFSAAITRVLPFHEMNSEIAARTTPTALDLATAAFCAVAGVYAAMRPSSDVATTAAGTSIGISLVPPLCVIGYGVGTSSWSVAYGAGLLFSTNFVAIVTIGMAAFAAAGFARVDVRALERAEDAELEDARWTRAAARKLSALFAFRGGPWLRLLMPLALLGAVYVPLRRGLDEVAWQIGARARVQEAISALPGRVVESRVRVERGEIELDIFLLGSRGEADSAKSKLAAAIGPEARGALRLDVHAVPDAADFEALEQALYKPAPPVPIPAVAPPPEPEKPATRDVLAAIVPVIEARWPSDAAGWPLAVDVRAVEGALDIRVVHLGAALDAAARETIGKAVGQDLEEEVVIVSEAIPRGALRPVPGEVAWVAEVAAGAERSKRTSTVRICLTVPRPPAGDRAEPAKVATLRRTLAALVGGHPRVDEQAGPWSIRFAEDTCAE